MANDPLHKSPCWPKSLWHMENELRRAARNGLILRKEEASEHLAEARRVATRERAIRLAELP
jgi:hypothetical protein